MFKINSFIVAGLIAVSLYSRALASDCSEINDAMKEAYDKANEMAVGQVKTIMKKPDLSGLDGCLGGLSGSLGGFTLPGIPNLDDLLSQFCDAVVDTVYDTAMDGIGDDVKSIDTFGIYDTSSIGANRTGSGATVNGPDINIEKPDIDLHKSIENIFK